MPDYERLYEVPFSSERKRMDVQARPANGVHCCSLFARSQAQSFTKGMPELVLSNCTTYFAEKSMPLDDERRGLLLKKARSMAEDGLRVLALSYETHFAGFVGITDPPRPGVSDAVQQLRSGGVKCFMITGDAKETALAIARRCSLFDFESDIDDSVSSNDAECAVDRSMSGEEIEQLDASKGLATAISNGVRVFYRVCPHHKLKIVRARTYWC